MLRGNESGNGRLGCLVVLALVGAFGFVSIRLLPAYLAKVEFQESFDRLVSRAGAEAMSPDAVRKNVERLAEMHGFTVVPETLKTRRRQPYASPAQIHVEVVVMREVPLPGYTHRVQFGTKGSSFIGRL